MPLNCAVPVVTPHWNGTGWLVNVNVVFVVPPGSLTLAATVSGADGVVVIDLRVGEQDETTTAATRGVFHFAEIAVRASAGRT